jgi:hypothetical protein
MKQIHIPMGFDARIPTQDYAEEMRIPGLGVQTLGNQIHGYEAPPLLVGSPESVTLLRQREWLKTTHAFLYPVAYDFYRKDGDVAALEKAVIEIAEQVDARAIVWRLQPQSCPLQTGGFISLCHVAFIR